MDGQSIVIGFAGGIGCGKSTIAYQVEKEFGDQALVVQMEHFSLLPIRSEADGTIYVPNAPEEFDIDLMVKCVSELKAGKDTLFPVYGFKKSDMHYVTIKAKPVIILDGELLFAIPEIRDLIDIKVFVDIDADIRIMRRVHSHIIEKHLSLESLIEQYLVDDKPTHDTYVEPSKKYADIIIPEGGYNSVAFRMVVSLLKDMLRQKEQ